MKSIHKQRHRKVQSIVEPSEPDWEELIALGIPLSSPSGSTETANIELQRFIDMISSALDFISFHSETPVYQRHRDAMRGFILALKTHYPTVFEQIDHPYAVTIVSGQICGRDIKLRNIALEHIARYL